MKPFARRVSAVSGLLLALTATVPSPHRNAADNSSLLASQPFQPRVPTDRKAAVLEAYGRLPLDFEENRGQTDRRVKFLARGGGGTLFLSSANVFWRFKTPRGWAALRMRLLGSNTSAQARGLDALSGVSNYFIGNDSKKWHTAVPHYAKVEYQGIYPGVDLVYHGTQRQLEYDFVVSPGADPRRIGLQFDGADRVRIDAQGNLVLHTVAGEVRHQRPIIYQQIGAKKRVVGGGYSLDSRQRVHFELAAYDPNWPLVIDPLVYSTYLGGNGADDGEGIAVDSSGNVYVTGATASAAFPTTAGAYSQVWASAGFGDGLEEDAYVTKLNPTGTALIYSTYLGGLDNDQGNAVVVDSSGNAYVAGVTASTNFPITPGAYQNAPGTDSSGEVITNGFVAKLNPAGSSLVYSTYLHKTAFGVVTQTQVIGLAVLAGNAYVAGNNLQSTSTDTADINDGFVAELNTTGGSLIYYYSFGGMDDDEVESLTVDASGDAYVVGETKSTDFPATPGAYQTKFGGGDLDGFVLKLNPAGSASIFATYLGGKGTESVEDVALDAAGNVYLTGSSSGSFPTTPGAYQTTPAGGNDAFVVKLNPAGTALIYSTYLGGTGDEHSDAMALDAAGYVYLAGSTLSKDFPVTPGAPQKTFAGGSTDGDAFVAKLNPTGSALVFSTYLGGKGDDYADAIAIDASGNVYITGFTPSTDFPVSAGAFQNHCGTDATCNNAAGDAFVAKIDTTTGVPASINVVSGNNQSGAPGTLLPMPLVVQVVDVRKAPVPGATVTFSATNGSVNPSSAITDSSGDASAQVTLGSASGMATVTATSGGASAMFSFTISIAPQVTVTSVLNGASFAPGIQDGSWTSIIGTNLSATTRTWNTQTEIVNGILPTSLDGVSVTFDGKPAAVYYISPTQLNVQTPITGKTGPVPAVVTNAMGTAQAMANVTAEEPALFLFDPQNRRYPAALIVRTDGGVDYLGPVGLFGSALVTRPAKPGEVLELFGTAFGPTNPVVAAGKVFSGAAPVVPPNAVTAMIGGVSAQVLFAGITGAGLYQINVTVPNVAAGDQKVILSLQGLQTQDGVFVAVTHP